MQKVLLIGGSPRVGKSTAAALLASKLLRPCISTDDIGLALQSVLDINPMKGYPYPDYYAMRTKQELIDDIIAYHKKVEPAIARLVETHSAWGNPLVMEGWALYPKLVRRIENAQVFSVWMIAEPGLFESRMRRNSAFLDNATEPEKVIEGYLHRSQWHNQTLLSQCRAGQRNVLFVGERTTPEEVVGEIVGML